MKPKTMDEPRTVAPGNAPLVYVVLHADTLARICLRTDFKVHETYEEALSRQIELGQTNPQRSWVISFPDPRAVAND